MKTVLLNLPSSEQVFRRYMCSYNSPTSLFPPIELASLAGIAKDRKKQPVIIIDAIAEKLTLEDVIRRLEEFKADLVVSLTGFEIFNEDMAALSKIKEALPKIHIGCFGHYPTLFPKETMNNSRIDFILLNEPDTAFSEIIDRISTGRPYHTLKGVVARNGKTIVVNKQNPRIKDLDKLPFPAHGLLKLELYSETMMDKPFTVLQTTRGCPYACRYCVHTYGYELANRSAESVLGEIDFVVKKLGVRSFRFFDDTFNYDKARIKKICEGLIDRNYNITWTAFSRVDTLDEEVLKLMKAAGCKRLFVGIESGSQRILNLYAKGYNAKKIPEKIRMARSTGLEITGFFMVAPQEAEEDFRESVKLAKESDFDYVLVTKLTAYPGTPLFEEMKNDVEFSLFPYHNKFKGKGLEDKYIDMEKRFYKAFYYRPGYILKRALMFLSRPRESLYNAAKLTAYLFGIQKSDTRSDYF